MLQTVELPIWLFVLIVAFAAVTFASHFLFPSVRWFFRRRLERAVERLNTRLTRPIEPFKLAARQDMIQRLCYDPQVAEAIVEYARKKKVREDVAFERARKYAREIVPSFSAFAYFGFGIRVARFLANFLYTVRTSPNNDRVIASLSKEATVVFVMNHRSNMDYLLVTYLAARSSALSYAVGEWARIWPLSRLIKSMGAYFIRRKSRGLLYRKVLARYVHMATTGGVTQAIFPEGGLSLDGKLAPPKMGLLGYVVEAGCAAERDVIFVPVAINYDRVLEDRVLTAANKRGDRKFGARISVVVGFIVINLWRRICGRFLRFGSAAVVFGEPLSMSNYSNDGTLDTLAVDLMRKIEEAMPHLAVPLLAQVLLKSGGTMQLADLRAQAIQHIASDTARFLLSDDEMPEDYVDKAIGQLVQRRVVTKDGDRVHVVAEHKDVLQYYANSIAEAEMHISASAK